MESEKKRTDEYWMGVRDALRMIDSFIKWARRNEDRAKSLDDFIYDGLVAAAKRCESCLKDDLGLKFAEGESSTETSEVEQVPSGYEAGSTMEIPADETFEFTPEDKSPDSSDVPIVTESDSISIDSVGRLEEEEIEDLSIDGPQREFSTDFELVEPTDLVVDSTPADVEEPPIAEPEVEEEISEETESKPSFTWADYEKAVAPAEKDHELDEGDEDVELPPPMKIESMDESSDKVSTPEPPEPPTEEFESVVSEDEETSDSSGPITEPPAPPPPPESDEDEDERRRRARRLFFGD
ncbi:MAG: hypothetical protein ACFFE2_03305 [Candidatus Thorarchaeota archaeon]